MTASSCDITLFVPGLLGPQPIYKQLTRADKPDLQQLEVWLSRAKRSATAISDPLAGLFSLFNLLTNSRETAPVAAVTAAFDGLAVGQGWWLRADPVYLQPDRHQAVLVASDDLELSVEESAALVETLNRHFAADDMSLQAPHPQRWYLQLQEAEEIQTTPLPEVMGQGVNEHLPQGKQRQQWHGWLNEVQMVLHQHPVNQQRLQAGKLPVNSVWLWGEGSVPTVAAPNFEQVYGDDILLEALAQFTDAGYAPLSDFDPRDDNGRCLIVINTCYTSVKNKDVFAWLECLEAVQNQVLRPWQTDLKRHSDCTITLLPANGQQYQMTRKNLSRWWRRRHSLETFLSQ
jgi:hypothetical protein